MEFDFFTFLNCMLENLSMLLFWSLLDTWGFKRKQYLVAYVALCCCAIPVTLIDSVLFTILPFNFVLIFTSMWIAFYRIKFKEALLHTLFMYLILLYLQCVGVCFLPQALMGTNLGNFLVNTAVLVCAGFLIILTRKYNFKRFYENNSNIVWAFLVVLCVPEIVIVQFFIALLGSAATAIMVILVLLQILYMSLVILFFFIIKRNSDRRKLHDTQKYIDDLNELLNDSRKNMHDFNKHIRYLYNLVRTRSENQELNQEVDSYCKELIESYNEDSILLQLENSIFRALLYGRVSQAKKENIDFRLEATPVLPAFPVKNYQLVEIFDNLMDNAFECVAELSENRRWVRVALTTQSQKDGTYLNMFCIENPCEDVNLSEITNGKAFTSKRGKHQGVGLRSVSQSVRDTGGDLIINAQNGVFSVTVAYKVKDKSFLRPSPHAV